MDLRHHKLVSDFNPRLKIFSIIDNVLIIETMHFNKVRNSLLDNIKAHLFLSAGVYTKFHVDAYFYGIASKIFMHCNIFPRS